MNYQQVVDRLRRHEDDSAQYLSRFAWPGHRGQARSRYPNIAAELAARNWHLEDAAHAALVSNEVMAGVIEDGEELTVLEMLGIAQRFNVKMTYLTSPVLSVVNPTTRKGRLRQLELEQAWAYMEKTRIKHWGVLGGMLWDTLQILAAGEPVPYACYSWPLGWIAYEQYQAQQAQNVRTVRRRTA